ncbi:hypothetical protein L6452_41126 [Arctium lappa]|uniref:Uncharacterized protein n=1 Tax=Arctium lappa TaxID=4217 RepID=A0ACB8XPL0_ARCLA|nr:hypothetical protein L6452_41126 [Arctium lappa]
MGSNDWDLEPPTGFSTTDAFILEQKLQQILMFSGSENVKINKHRIIVLDVLNETMILQLGLNCNFSCIYHGFNCYNLQSKMMFSRGAKESIEILCRRVGTPIHSRYRENFISEPKRNGTGTFVRKYSSDASPSDNMYLIKKLRERTSAPIKEAKSALIDCNWDLEVAQTEMQKRGIVLASKKLSRTAAEGLLALAQNDTKAAVIELNYETNFVARNQIFQYLKESYITVSCGNFFGSSSDTSSYQWQPVCLKKRIVTQRKTSSGCLQ